eukprot:6150671-Amphidinium_carterae.1
MCPELWIDKAVLAILVLRNSYAHRKSTDCPRALRQRSTRSKALTATMDLSGRACVSPKVPSNDSV